MGIATALGRTFNWSLGGLSNQRRVLISVTAAAGRTQIRAEERLSQYAGGIFGGILGGGGGGVGSASVGLTMGTMHSPLAAALVASSVVAGAYMLARTIFARTSRTRATELEGLVSKLATQITVLVAHDQGPRALR